MPKVIKSSIRETILKVRAFCEEERRMKAPLIPFEKVDARVAAMTGVSERSVQRIAAEGRAAERSSTKISTPGKKRKRKNKVLIDDFDPCAVTHIDHTYV